MAAFDEHGQQIGIVFQTSSPFDTPRLMGELVSWVNAQRESKLLHPLLVTAIFVVVFLEIHPFQDGNGRISRALTTLMLLQAGNPRSLLTCATTAHNVLQTLSGGDAMEVVRQAGALSAHCRYARIDEIVDHGLETWLQEAMARLVRLSDAIHRQFMVSTDVAPPVTVARPWASEQ